MSNDGFGNPVGKDTLIETLELSNRAKTGLRNMGLYTVGNLIKFAEKDLLKSRNFGRKSIDEIKTVLRDLGFQLYEGLEAPQMNEADKVWKIMICAAKRGYIVTDGANPRVLESPHLIRVFETKDSLLAWLTENLAEDVVMPDPANAPG